MDIGNPAVSFLKHMAQQQFHASHIVRSDIDMIVKKMVHRHHRNIAAYQFQNLGVIEIHAGDNHPVKAPVAAMLQVGHPAQPSRTALVQKCDIIAPGFHRALEAVQHLGEIVMGQAALGLVHKEHAYIVGAVCLKGPGHGIGQISHLLGDSADPLLGLPADVSMVVQRLAHRGHRDSAGYGNVLH